MPIASSLADRTLAARGVAARYRIADLGFGRQRLTDVVIGDPARPDLVADWIETRTGVGLTGARLTGVRAGRVRVRGRIVDGRVSFGALDRLLPAGRGGGFALPAIDLDLADGAMRLETPYGPLALRLAGAGRLDGGFRGTLAVAGARLATGDCAIVRPALDARIAVTARVPTLAGSWRAAEAACSTAMATAPAGEVRVALSPGFDRWSGDVRASLAALAQGGRRLDRLSAAASFAGTAAAITGEARLRAARFAAPEANGGAVVIDGRWTVGRAPGFAGTVSARDVVAGSGSIRQVLAVAGAADGTPLGPLVRKAALAAGAAARRFDLSGRIAAGSGEVGISDVALTAASGARAALDRGTIAVTRAGLGIDGRLVAGGGGLPAIRALVRRTTNGRVAGTATVAPYAARDASLALAPVTVSGGPAAMRIETRAIVSGPIGAGSGQGRVDGLSMAVDARIAPGRIVLNRGCAPVGFRRLAVAGLRLSPATLAICPRDGALLRIVDGRVSGGARFGAVRLSGMLGASPVAIDAAGGEIALADMAFAVRAPALRLGDPARATRLGFASLDGTVAEGGVTGRFTGGEGRIGAVPLALSAATGGWRLADGALTATGALMVADTDPAPRFVPLAAREVTLRLAGNTITAAGALVAPASDVPVGGVRLIHDLARGAGHAYLAVPGIVFGDRLQPDALTRFSYGVVADVAGTVSGDARINWDARGVTSTGTFRTTDMNLAAAFGPVEGLSTEIRFTDLLSLESAPDQVATVRSINPGIPVTDGRIVYATLPGSRFAVAGARWPFAGGTLTLDPALLDFSSEETRRLTFRIAGMDAGQFLQQFEFDNITATGLFDGTLPMLFDAAGGRIEGGTLAVRPGGGTLAYVGALGEEDLGFWGNFAFQALRSLRYRDLALAMDGPLAGEMVTQVRFAGVRQGEGAKSNFVIRRLQRLPITFNVTIRAPFRGLIDSVASFYDPSRLVARNLPALIEEQERREAGAPPVQPPASAGSITKD